MTLVTLEQDEWWFPCVRRGGEYDVPEELVVRWENAIIELRAARNAIYDAADVKMDAYDRNTPPS